MACTLPDMVYRLGQLAIRSGGWVPVAHWGQPTKLAVPCRLRGNSDLLAPDSNSAFPGRLCPRPVVLMPQSAAWRASTHGRGKFMLARFVTIGGPSVDLIPERLERVARLGTVPSFIPKPGRFPVNLDPAFSRPTKRQRVADADGSGTLEHTTEVRFPGSQREAADASPIAAASAPCPS